MKVTAKLAALFGGWAAGGVTATLDAPLLAVIVVGFGVTCVLLLVLHD